MRPPRSVRPLAVLCLTALLGAGALALAVALWGVVQLGVAPGPLFDLAQAAVVPLLR